MDIFVTLWQNLADGISNGEVIIPDVVYKEVGNGTGELVAWLKQFDELKFDCFGDEAVLLSAKEVINKHPNLINIRNPLDQADPYVIALAQVKAATIICDESAKPDKIPAVCKSRNIECLRSHEFLRAKGWSF
jgi:hypothetical protein